ncbi:hypothetical protein DFH28DRAFT_882233 [Melampsora americana]|nr:hypothetical protein DFH28DRAFT_882233 [Melampsora americana]
MIKLSFGTRSKFFSCSLKWIYLICFCGIGLTHCALLRKRWEEAGLSPLLSKVVDGDESHLNRIGLLLLPIATSTSFPMTINKAMYLSDRGLAQFLRAHTERLSRESASSSHPPDHSMLYRSKTDNSHAQQSINPQRTPLEQSPLVIDSDYEGWIPGPEYVGPSTKKPRIASPEVPAFSTFKDKSRSQSSNSDYPLPPLIPSSLVHKQNPKSSFSSYNDLASHLLSDQNTGAMPVAAGTTLHSSVSSMKPVQPKPIDQDAFGKGHLTILPPDFIPSKMEPSLQHGPHTPQYREPVHLNSPNTIPYTPNSAVSHGTDFISPTQFEMTKTNFPQGQGNFVGLKPSVSSDSQVQSYHNAGNSPEVVSHHPKQLRTSQLSDSASYPGNPSGLKADHPSASVSNPALKSFHTALRVAKSLALEIKKGAGESKEATLLSEMDMSHSLGPTIYRNLMDGASEMDLYRVLLTFMKQHVQQVTSLDSRSASLIWLTRHLGVDYPLPLQSNPEKLRGRSHSEILEEWSKRLFSKWQTEDRNGIRVEAQEKVDFDQLVESLTRLATSYAERQLPRDLAVHLRRGEMTESDTVQILLATAELFPTSARRWNHLLLQRLSLVGSQSSS